MNQLPCITDKCLKYPACKNSVELRCDLLQRFIDKEVTGYRETQVIAEIWKYIADIFPKATCIHMDYRVADKENERGFKTCCVRYDIKRAKE